MAKYIYKGKEVTLVPGQQFTDGWNVYYPEDTENGGTIMRIHKAIPPEQEGSNLQILSDDAPIVAIIGGKVNDEIPNPTSVNINQVSFTELHKSLTGIGRASAKKILANKPLNGYQNLDELKELNQDLAINWDELAGILVFQ